MSKIQNLVKRVLPMIALVLMVGFFMVSSSAWAKDIKTLRIGIGIDADTLNPLELTTGIPTNLIELMYETLLKTNPQGEVIPHMATEWSASKDGLTWTMKLRKGIKFADGSTFNAETLTSNLALIQNPKVRMPLRFVYGPIKNINVVDDYTVQYILNAPFAPFDKLLANVVFPISQKVAANYDAGSFNKQSAGAGPYILAEWVRGERIVLVRNENYWGKRPTVEKLIYQIVPETATRVAMLRAGQLDVIYSPTPADVPALEANPDITVVRPLSTRMIFMSMNTQKGPTQNNWSVKPLITP